MLTFDGGDMVHGHGHVKKKEKSLSALVIRSSNFRLSGYQSTTMYVCGVGIQILGRI